jgi:hypothetical protein
MTTEYYLKDVISDDTPVSGEMVPPSHMLRDTNFAKGDRLMHNGKMYEIVFGGNYRHATVRIVDLAEKVPWRR